MTNPARILEKLMSRPTDLSYHQVYTLLFYLGWKVREGRTGSHFVCTSPSGNNFTLVRSKGKVSRVYLNMILKEIERGGGV